MAMVARTRKCQERDCTEEYRRQCVQLIDLAEDRYKGTSSIASNAPSRLTVIM
jgi:hypothetical protein